MYIYIVYSIHIYIYNVHIVYIVPYNKNEYSIVYRLSNINQLDRYSSHTWRPTNGGALPIEPWRFRPTPWLQAHALTNLRSKLWWGKSLLPLLGWVALQNSRKSREHIYIYIIIIYTYNMYTYMYIYIYTYIFTYIYIYESYMSK